MNRTPSNSPASRGEPVVRRFTSMPDESGNYNLKCVTPKYIQRRHPNMQYKGYWNKRYYTMGNGHRWILTDKMTGATLNQMCHIPIQRFIKVRQDMRVYDVNAIEYWNKREYLNARDAIVGSKNLTLLFRRQKGRCDYCNQPLTNQQVKDTAIHQHHLKPRSEGGDWRLRNLRLLHADCHTSLHGTFSRREMADLINRGIDYLRLMKPAMQ